MNDVIKNFKNIPVKEKIMLHLSVDLADQIEDTIFSLRKRLPRHRRKQLTKSAFYELIMTTIIGNFNEMGNKSLLVKLVDEWFEESSE
jgi:hypothetical protein